ncbi:MAG: hypothetical protein LBL24_04030 [Bacteroidales bacterium]|jgi:hypothetical protein|nr:hypothetical protein [Bacteroidales bacterium]
MALYKRYIIIVMIGFLLCTVTQAQTEKQRMVFKAMEDELQRNMDSLSIGKWGKPFFIQYVMQEGRLFQVQATMGAITGVNEFPVSSMSAQALVGNYQLANINLSNTDYRSGARGDVAPLDDNYDEIRRRLWLLSDNVYKSAIEEYSNKMTSIRQLNLPPEVLELPDFTRLPAATYYGTAEESDYHKAYWEKIARDCSAVFKNYPKIYGSNVGIEIYSGQIYSINSEGTRLLHPVRLVVMAVNAYTKLEDGEEISDRLAYYGLSEADFPDADRLVKDIETMAGNIIAVTQAPKMDESYTGPVMLEGDALATEMASELLAPRTGLVAFRTALKSGGVQRLMEDRLNRRILSTDITVKSMPHQKTYDGQVLIGSYETDAEGVTPVDELLLVENGMLRALMCDRIPTKKIKTPTGNRIYAYQPQGISTRVSPGVLSISTSNGLSRDTLKTRLLAAARTEGLDYAYIVRTLPAGRYSSLYKVSVADGSEQLVRAGVLSRMDLSKLKRSLGTSAENVVVNMIAGGVPVSVVGPNAMVIEDVEIEKQNLQNTTKLPTVSNPLTD